MGNKTELTIILPIYNPPVGWEKLMDSSLIRVFELFKNINISVILVNDGSQRSLQYGFDTLKLFFNHIEVISYSENKGKGFAIKTVLSRADSPYYIYTDWDFPFGEESLLEIFKILKQNKIGLVLGSRGKDYFASLPLFRSIISRGLRIVNYFFLNFKYLDTQAGVKGLNRDVRDIFMSIKTQCFIFELEFVRACIRKKIVISSIKISPRENIVFSNFNLKTIFLELKAYFKLFFS